MGDTLRVTSRILALLLVMLIITCAFPTSYAQSIPDILMVPELRPGSAYSISSAEGLRRLAELVNSGMNMKDIYFVLDADIVLNPGSFDEGGVWSEAGEPALWTPIGNTFHEFSGRFDGAGHSISGMYCSAGSGFVGLFGRIIDGSVENLTIKNSYIKGAYYIGGIAGYALSLDTSCGISNCNVEITVDCVSQSSAGAVVGCVVVGGGLFSVERCASVSNLPAVGMSVGEVFLGENSETILAPAPGEDTSLSWLWITLILIGCLASLSVLLIKNYRERKSVAALPGAAEADAAGTAATGTFTAAMTAQLQPEPPETTGEIAEEPAGSDRSDPAKGPDEYALPGGEAPETGAKTVLSARETARPRTQGYYYIKQTPDGYMFNLKAANHEILATSQVYQLLPACKKAIMSLAKNVSAAVIDDLTEPAEDKVYAPKFEIYTDNAGQYRFRIKAANYEIIATSQGYATKSGCRSAIDSVVRNAETKKLILEDEETAKRREKLRAEIVRAEKITVEDANSLIDDLTAEVLLETLDSEEGHIKRQNCVDVWLDTIGEHFDSGDIVNTAALIRKGLVPPNTRHIRVLGRGMLDKALTVEANQFSLDAVKMIVLTGGNTVRTND